ncbi:ATP-binding protein [bacterium]|nr:ATP-binding protein [bacterium]
MMPLTRTSMEAHLADAGSLFLKKDVMYLSQRLSFREVKPIPIKDFYLLRVTNVCYDEQAPKKEALENVLSSLKMDGINFVFLIVCKKEKVDFYYGISKDLSSNKAPEFAIKDIGDHILTPSIQGNFRGSRVKALENDEKKHIYDILSEMPYAGVIEGVPGANKDDEKYQGIDRLINVMYGDEYCFLVIAKPLDTDAILSIQEHLYRFYDQNAPLAKLNLQSGKGSNTGTSASSTKGSSQTSGSSDSTTKTTGSSESDTHTKGDNSSTTKGASRSTTENESYRGNSISVQKSGSESKTKGESSSFSHQTGSNTSTSTATSTNTSATESDSTTKGQNTGTSESNTWTYECVNRRIQDIIKFMDDIVFPRLDYGKGKGTFLTSMCVFASKPTSLQKIKNTVTALYSGETGNKIPLQSFNICTEAKKAFASFQLPSGTLYGEPDEGEYLTHFAMHHLVNRTGPSHIGNWITTNELGMIAGLPQKEVVGLSLNEEVEFGLNFEKPKQADSLIELGCLIQNGNVLRESPVYLDKADLDKHIFVAGVTGSGKTTTCQTILSKANMPFLVIEPAKTEYRVMLREHKDLLIFTLGDNQTTPLRMNPLVFYKHESITSRVDMLCACIESAFDMEAAIPQIIEQALYESYEEKGWDIYNNNNKQFDNPFDGSYEAFPTISDLIEKCEEVVNKQGFDERLKNDYIGSIKARLLGLTSGGKGFLLNAQSSVDFIELLDHKVVFELENIRSSAEKSLIMGFILINLSEAIREKYRETGIKLQHITLVEEAHRLLSKHIPGDNPSKKNSVEMFSDMLAEIRKYGESLVIVDQIPNKLTPDVLKNTNTKIIHRIFAADDKDAVGNTIMLKDEQKEFLSNLPAGRAVYFTTGTDKAVQIQINRPPDLDTSSEPPSDDEIRKNESVIAFYCDHHQSGLFKGLECFKERPTILQFKCISALNNGLIDINSWNKEFKSTKTFSAETIGKIQAVVDTLGDCLYEYLQNYNNNLCKVILRRFYQSRS